MIEKLKRVYKAAIRSGKIYFVGKKLSAGFDYNIGCYLRVLDPSFYHYHYQFLYSWTIVKIAKSS